MANWLIFIIALLITAATALLFFAKLPESSNPALATALFVSLASLALASFWKPELKILAFSAASLVLFYGWIATANIWYLIGAIGLAVAAAASAKILGILIASMIAFSRILRKLAPFIRS